MVKRIVEILKKVADYELGGMVYDFLPHLLAGTLLAGTLHGSPLTVALTAVSRAFHGTEVAEAADAPRGNFHAHHRAEVK